MTATAQTLPPTAYDEFPYESHPFALSHPANLATVGTLFGLRPGRPQGARPRTGLRLRRQPHPHRRAVS